MFRGVRLGLPDMGSIQGDAAAGWSPYSEPTFNMYLDRDDFTPARWIDRGPEAYTWDQTTTGEQPTLETGNFGDQVEFAGIQNMATIGGEGPNVTDGTPFTIVADVDVQTPAANRILFWLNDAGSAGTVVLRVGASNLVEGFCGTNQATGPATTVSGDALIELSGDGTNFTAALNGIDGTAAVRTTIGTLDTWSLGNHGSNTSSPFGGGLRRALVFVGAGANDAELRQNARDWLIFRRSSVGL